MPKVLIPLAEGCEELEAVTLIDLLRRAQIEVISAGLQPGPVKASRGTVLLPDALLEQVKDDAFDMIVLPGGQPGSRNLAADARVIALVQRMAKQGKFTCAICAAPAVLAQAGILEGKQATAFPGTLNDTGHKNIRISESAVVCDGKVITSRGPGTAMDFALELIEQLQGPRIRQQVESALQRPVATGADRSA